MQSLLVLGLLIAVTTFSAMEYTRSSVNANDLSEARADNVAGNILQYNDLLVKYTLNHYDTLHLIHISNVGNVDGITILDYSQINPYTQMQLVPFLNYQSIVFNYTSNNESDSLPLLYVASSWDSAVIKAFQDIKFPEILGMTNQAISKRLYQGDSTYWTIPLLISQDKCNVTEVYSQLPNNINNDSQLKQVKSMFYKYCTQIEAAGQYKFLTYVFLEPVVKISS
jgi:hypothetical protein